MKRTRLTVALDMLIEYLLQQTPPKYAASLDRPGVGQASGAHEVGSGIAAELAANTGCNAFATEG